MTATLIAPLVATQGLARLEAFDGAITPPSERKVLSEFTKI